MTIEELEQTVAAFTGKSFAWFDEMMVIATHDESRVHLEYNIEEDEVYMYCHVASIPQARFGAYAVELLHANLFGKDTGGSAVLAYDPEECRVIIWDKFKLTHLTQDGFRERFSLLYLSRLYWSNKLREEILDNQTDAMHAYIGG